MRLATITLFTLFVTTVTATAAPFKMLTGVDVGRYPGTARPVAPSPGPGFPNTLSDGDRLAGTSDTGAPVVFQGVGTPMYAPNHLGSLSFLFRRGSVPIPGAGQVPLQGIDFLGGPLLDLDGDLNNGVRSLVPVTNQTPVEIPNSYSQLGLAVNYANNTVSLSSFDATATNEGGPQVQAEIATVLVTIAGTTPTGGVGSRPNPSWDTRTGTLTPFSGTGGTLSGVYAIGNLPFELWYDSIDPTSSSAAVLGTLQHFGKFRGWLIVRDCASGQFPTLAGNGLGTTLWPKVDATQVGATFNTANGLSGGTAVIANGVPGDQFNVAGNGGVALTDNGGDLGAYFDSVVKPLVPTDAESFVYLEAAGFGINNSADPVFTDTDSYDVVIVAASAGSVLSAGDINGDGVVDLTDAQRLADILVNPQLANACELKRADVNGDQLVNGQDVAAFVRVILP